MESKLPFSSSNRQVLPTITSKLCAGGVCIIATEINVKHQGAETTKLYPGSTITLYILGIGNVRLICSRLREEGYSVHWFLLWSFNSHSSIPPLGKQNDHKSNSFVVDLLRECGRGSSFRPGLRPNKIAKHHRPDQFQFLNSSWHDHSINI